MEWPVFGLVAVGHATRTQLGQFRGVIPKAQLGHMLAPAGVAQAELSLAWHAWGRDTASGWQ